MVYQFIPSDKAKTGIDSINSFPSMPASALLHKYSPGGSYQSAWQKIKDIFEASKTTFKQNSGFDFDRWNPVHQEEMVRLMHADSRMGEVLRMLKIPESQLSNIQIPWWNELAAKEGKHRPLFGKFAVELEQRHSYQTQAMRKGFEIKGMNAVSVVGLAITEDNYFVIGLRGGRNFPMAYYYSAGALGLTEGIKAGTESVWDFYAKHELVEYPIETHEVKSASLKYRLRLYGGDWDTSYVFLLKTSLKFSEIEKRHAARLKEPEKYPHAGEHVGFEPLAMDEKSIISFVQKFYKGVVANDKNRKFEDRLLLPQAAGPLLGYAASTSLDCANHYELLDSLAQEGSH